MFYESCSAFTFVYNNYRLLGYWVRMFEAKWLNHKNYIKGMEKKRNRRDDTASSSDTPELERYERGPVDSRRGDANSADSIPGRSPRPQSDVRTSKDQSLYDHKE